MRFKLILIALMFFGLLGCKKDKGVNPYKNIKSITGTMMPSEGPFYGQKFVADEEVYDNEGRMISSVKGSFVSNNPSNFNSKTYTYKDGRLYETKDGGEATSEYIYTNNLVSEIKTYYGDNYPTKTIIGKQTFVYDGQGRKVRMTAFSYLPGFGRNPPPPNANGYTYTYEYDANNLLHKESDQGGTVKSYEYDGHKNLTKVTYSNTFWPNTVYGNETYTYKYDYKDRITETTQADYSGETIKTTIAYDYEGRVQTKDVYKNFNGIYYQVSTITYTYQYF
ncbi:hypothetical protein [Mucilaginibacter sp. HD30]